MIERFAGCFTDCRDPDLLEHPLVDLLKQRIFGLCPGYDDAYCDLPLYVFCGDHPLLALLRRA